MIISDERLTEIHAKVYAKHGYPFQEGLRAFVRGRRWAKENDNTAVPPRGIVEKLRLWAEINSAIQQEVIRLEQEEKTNAKNQAGNGDNSANSGKPDGGAIKVSPDPKREA